ncbi:MAG: hypothetical protein AAFY63_11010 [Cyanobacteria bacterium J06643_13]
MNNSLIISTLVLFSSVGIMPQAIAQVAEPNDTRIEKYEDLTETEAAPAGFETEADMESEDGVVAPTTRAEETFEEAATSDLDNPYDVRRTEAFNLVSSAYRGEFEEQGVNSYAVLISNYETGELTAEDLIGAAIESGELSPMALEDDSYVRAVDAQLQGLTQS